jgi:hypothetical protein
MWVVAPTGSLTIFDSNVTDMFRVRFATALMTLYAAVLLGVRAFWFYASIFVPLPTTRHCGGVIVKTLIGERTLNCVER